MHSTIIKVLIKSIAWLCVSLLFLSLVPLSQPSSAKELDLANSENYAYQYVGATGETVLGYVHSWVGDIDGNGKADLILSQSSNTSTLYIIFDSTIETQLSLGKTLDLDDTATYNIRLYNSIYESLFYGINVSDVNQDGRNDLAISHMLAGYNTRTSSGSMYILYNDLLTSFSGTGNSADLNNSSSWNVRIDGAADNSYFSDECIIFKDFNNDNLTDLLTCDYLGDQNGRTDSGSVYLIYNEAFSGTSGTGNTIDMADSSNWHHRWDGETAGDSIGSWLSTSTGDFNGDGKLDFTFGSHFMDKNSRNNSGSAYIIFNELFANNSGTGNTYDLADDSSYNIRIDGNTGNALLGRRSYVPIWSQHDLTGNGSDDLFLKTINNGFIVTEEVFSTYGTTTGNEIDLASSDNYNLKISGPSVFISAELNDFTNDNVPDFIAGMSNHDLGGHTNNGAVILVNSIEFSHLIPGVGQEYDITSGTFLSFIGSEDNESLGGATIIRDLNADYSPDFLLTGYKASNPPGKVYAIYSFPHTLSASHNNGDAGSKKGLLLTGNVSATDSATAISGVQYNIGSNTQNSTEWIDCTASDGSFNSTSEDYSCEISELSTGSHTIFIRAFDEVTVYTPQALYGSISISAGNRDFSIRSPSEIGSSGQDAIKPGGSTHINTVVFAWHQSNHVQHYKVYTRDLGSDTWDETQLGNDDDSYEKYFEEGDYEWKIRAVHTDGEVSDTKTYSFTVDNTISEPLTVADINFKALAENDHAIPQATNLRISGYAEEGTSVLVQVWDESDAYLYQSIECTAVAVETEEASGRYTCEAPAELYGSYTIHVSGVDNSGNLHTNHVVKLSTY